MHELHEGRRTWANNSPSMLRSAASIKDCSKNHSAPGKSGTSNVPRFVSLVWVEKKQATNSCIGDCSLVQIDGLIRSWVRSLRILHSFVASRCPPLFDPHYKLEADSKFCALKPLAINHTRQRLNAFLWSTNQQMLPRSAVPVRHDAGTPRTHILSDRALNKLRFVQVRLVQTQKLYRHCPGSALFISASRYMHLGPLSVPWALLR